MNYCLISGMRVERANALPHQQIITPPTILPALGFAHNLERRLGDEDFSICGVAMLYHDAQLLGEGLTARDGYYKFQPQQYRAATFISKVDAAQGGFSVAMQPTASCHLHCSLLLAIDGAADSSNIERLVLGGRFAGGAIVDLKSVKTNTDVSELLQELPRAPAFWVIDRKDLMEANPDPLDALLDAVASVPKENAEAQATAAPSSAWVMPAVLGYAALTSFESRGGVRELDDGTRPKHAFVETLVGLIQYVSRRHYPENQPYPFWKASWVRPDVYLAEQISPKEDK